MDSNVENLVLGNKVYQVADKTLNNSLRFLQHLFQTFCLIYITALSNHKFDNIHDSLGRLCQGSSLEKEKMRAKNTKCMRASKNVAT